MFGSLGFPELLIIMIILLILFGYKRIGQLGKGLGEGIRNFKDAVRPSEPERETNNEPVEPK